MCKLDELKKQTKELDEKVGRLESAITKSSADVVKMVQHFLKDMEEIKDIVKENAESTKDIKDAWTTATGLARFVKWVSIVSVPAVLAWNYGKDLLTWKIGG